MKSFVRAVCLLFVMTSVVNLWSQERDKVDLETIGRIRYEGFRNSKVMDYASGLMDSIGERLTGSPNMKRANEWTRDQLAAMGLIQRAPRTMGAFRPRLGESIHQRAHDLARCRPLLVYAKAWTPGTNGVVQGKCIRVNIDKKKTSTNTKASLPE
jgi:carboxypeptidase Q